LSALAESGSGLIGPSRDAAALRRLYADYASVAARPYARATWELMLRAEQRQLGQATNNCSSGATKDMHADIGLYETELRPKASLACLDWLSPVKPANILTLLSDAPALYVRGDSLVCRDDDLILKYERRSHKPYAIVLTGWGGRITIGALRFCADHDVAIIILDWGRELMSVALTHAERAERILRAQVGANGLSLSKSIIDAKINAHCNVGAMDRPTAAWWLTKVKSAPDIRHDGILA
jgi:hypothetical protein